MIVRQLRAALVVLAGMALAACDIVGPGEPLVNPGPVDVVLASPRQDDGAIMFSLSGGVVDSVSSLGYGVYQGQIGPQAYRVIVSGDIVSGPVARLWLPDRNKLAPYTLSIEQVATRVTYQQQPSDGYLLRLVVP